MALGEIRLHVPSHGAPPAAKWHVIAKGWMNGRVDLRGKVPRGVTGCLHVGRTLFPEISDFLSQA